MAKSNYKEAQTELEKIVSDIEGGKVSIDALYDKIKRAKELADICHAKLRDTDGEIKKILSKK